MELPDNILPAPVARRQLDQAELHVTVGPLRSELNQTPNRWSPHRQRRGRKSQRQPPARAAHGAVQHSHSSFKHEQSVSQQHPSSCWN